MFVTPKFKLWLLRVYKNLQHFQYYFLSFSFLLSSPPGLQDKGSKSYHPKRRK